MNIAQAIRHSITSVVLAAALVVATMSAAPALERGILCAMFAHDIAAMADEHLNYPDESRDDLVARYIEAALLALHAAGKDVPLETLARYAGRIVDYVEAHSGLPPAKLNEQFVADCRAFNW
jgi:hypothetical protein